MAHIANCCVLNLCQVQHYSRDEHERVSGFQSILFSSSAWTKDVPCLPWKWKLLSSPAALKTGSFPPLWVDPLQVHFWCNPHAGYLSTHLFYPSPSVFSQTKSSGPQRTELQSAAWRSGGLSMERCDHRCAACLHALRVNRQTLVS